MEKIISKFMFLAAAILFLTSCAVREGGSPGADKPMYKNIRQPAVAGQFYPADAGRLASRIKSYLAEAGKAGKKDFAGTVRALMVPHAGYDFSGQAAAYGYRLLEGRKAGAVVIICNSHSAYFDGIAIDDADAWQTPLGIVPVDRGLAEKLVGAGDSIRFNGQVHAAEHSLEVQLPFLQAVLAEGFRIVPILFGNAGGDGYGKLARALSANLGDDDIVVASSDMSHYPAYDDASEIDSETLAAIKSADIGALENHIAATMARNIAGEETLLCGIDGVKTVMELYGISGWNKAEAIHYANSGDTEAGDKERVVGYGVAVFGSAEDGGDGRAAARVIDLSAALNKTEQARLLRIARETVESFARNGRAPDFDVKDERLNARQGAFVTLRENGQLRGCIGQIVPSEDPLWRVVRDMAVAACSEDGRFNPVAADELGKLDYEVSVLSIPEKIDDWRKIELGKHGVIVRKGYQGGVFLPQVATETGWSREEFLAQLCSQKAGLSPDCFRDDKGGVELQVFTAQVFR